MNEEWRDVVGHEGLYSVSSAGRIRRDGRGRRAQAGRLLSPQMREDGYLQVALSDCGVTKRALAHRLVAIAFVAGNGPGMTVNHIDGDKKNNCSTNLEWLSQKENVRHAFSSGLVNSARGHRVATSKLSYAIAEEIRASYVPRNKYFGQAALARKFGVHREAVSNIISGVAWV